ncbi:hypothetical protein LR48_Vigan01g066800 [Vigna angularis]|uniref:Uncharacterized protein n=1 Tax=Phaseolus angularis TaxID=3914 RepID=A0A0L9TKJ1_PHAAN|nr:hypothetical protein LR48_Vigan01g066800 [Vigna angularis]
MAEPSKRRRRRRSEVSESNIRRRDATIEGWLSDEQDQHSFSTFWKERKLIKQKFIDLSWYTYSNFSFPNLIIEQGVQHIMELRGKYYPDLVRIFYFNLKSIPLNWPHLIQTIMLKAKRLDLAPLPYPLLVSKICEYKGVNITNEHYEHVLPGHKIGDNSLR